MFSRVFSNALSLQIRDHVFQFRTPRDLEFALSGKTSPSSQRTAAIVRLSDTDLIREVESFKQMEQKVSQALARCHDDPNAADEFLRDLDITLVHEDNEWREFLWALARSDGKVPEFKRVALSKYLQFLESAQALVRAIFAERRRPAGADAAAADAVRAAANEVRPRQSLAFSIADILGREPARLEFNRLPKGEAIAVEFEPHQSLCVMLAKHRFTLASGDPWLLIDASGNDRQVRPEECLVGRHPEADILVYPGYRSVSRRHLIIETRSDTLVHLTDTSSLGTFVPLPNLYALKV